MKIKSIWFTEDMLYVQDENCTTYCQSLLWYPRLLNATEREREEYFISDEGIHWRQLDEDVSFESFEYEDAIPSEFQKFFLTHREINIAEFAKLIGINASLLRNYINGQKKPSPERLELILQQIHKLSKEYGEANWKYA